MAKLLRCPSCTAPLEVEKASGVVRCTFCGQTVSLPGEGEQPRPARASKAPLAIGAVVALLVLFGIVAAVGVGVWSAARPAAPSGPRPELPRFPIELKQPEPAASPLADRFLEFGTKGIGPGQFEDNRSVAVGPDGRIYVAEYSTGRLQVFDASGKFQTQWLLDPDRVVLDVLADRGGRVFVLYPSTLVVYEGATGKVVREITRFSADDLTLTPDNRLLALGDDEIMTFDETGAVTARITGLRQRANAKRMTDFETLAADGLGNLYLLERISSTVFKFDRTGAFVDRFGGEDREGGFLSSNDIAVDGQGRVLVSSVLGIRVFDQKGEVVGTIPQHQAFGMTLTDSGELFVAARPQVVAFRLK